MLNRDERYSHAGIMREVDVVERAPLLGVRQGFADRQKKEKKGAKKEKSGRLEGTVMPASPIGSTRLENGGRSFEGLPSPSGSLEQVRKARVKRVGRKGGLRLSEKCRTADHESIYIHAKGEPGRANF